MQYTELLLNTTCSTNGGNVYARSGAITDTVNSVILVVSIGKVVIIEWCLTKCNFEIFLVIFLSDHNRCHHR